MNESWKPILVLDKKYSVSDLGRIRNNDTMKIMKTSIRKKDGYVQWTKNYNGKCYCWKLHRLVMLIFNPIQNAEFFDVNHIDENILNNALNNLEWLNKQDNQDYKRRKYTINQLFRFAIRKVGSDEVYNALRHVSNL